MPIKLQYLGKFHKNKNSDKTSSEEGRSNDNNKKYYLKRKKEKFKSILTSWWMKPMDKISSRSKKNQDGAGMEVSLLITKTKVKRMSHL